MLVAPTQRSKTKTTIVSIRTRFDARWSLKFLRMRSPMCWGSPASMASHRPARERSRSSFDVSAKRPLWSDRAEIVFTFTDVFNDFAIQREIDGQGFTALYQNFFETQVASLGLRYRF